MCEEAGVGGVGEVRGGFEHMGIKQDGRWGKKLWKEAGDSRTREGEGKVS